MSPIMFLRCTKVQLQPANRYRARNCLTVASRGWGFLKPHPTILCPWAIGPSCFEYGDGRRNHCCVQDGKLAVRVGAKNGNVSIFTDRHAHTRTHACTRTRIHSWPGQLPYRLLRLPGALLPASVPVFCNTTRQNPAGAAPGAKAPPCPLPLVCREAGISWASPSHKAAAQAVDDQDTSVPESSGV